MSPKQPAPTPVSASVHVLQRLHWVRFSRVTSDIGLTLLPGRIRLQSFDDPEEAERTRQRLEESVRAVVNPFRCGGPALAYQSAFDGDRLHDWVLDLGLTPPEAGPRTPPNWADWWRTRQAGLTPLQRDGIWSALDRIRFYEVVERPRRPLVYVVVRVNWEYNDEWYTAEPEGGKPFFACRTRQRAEELCAEYNEVAREMWQEDLDDEDPEDGSRAFDPQYRHQGLEHLHQPPQRDSRKALIPLAEAPFWEVIEVEMEA